MTASVLSNRIYYRFKPYLPWRLRMGMRRMVARRKREAFKNVWPINEMAGHAPNNWRGWPDNKQFALVLTHDVEGSNGLVKCRHLMELELQQGFRSSFNFIPEGDYRVPAEFRAELLQNGFEVGVHDLRHDGKLYWRRNDFTKSARSINGYLQDWNASGFRAAFMLHDRERLRHLKIEYDASTFDTDPFEPQPDGVNTIFPFWISDGNGGGYVELPYTLPQDSTLFLVLDEKSPEIWKTKLDWLVARGGMALLNVHPDYIGFNGKLNASEYPAAWYTDFLQYVKTYYAGKFWNPLPKEMARWFKENHRTKKTANHAGHQDASDCHDKKLPLDKTNAAVVLYSYYASDPRPRREAEALKHAGAQVDVICLRKNDSEPAHENLNGVNIYRIPLKRRRAGKIVYILQYAWFVAASFFLLAVWSFKKRYKIVHVHNMPDFLVFSGWFPRLRGAKIILDLHDPMPELCRSIYGLRESHFIIHWLEKMEKNSIAFADLVITPNKAFKELFASRSCAPEKIQTVMNSPEAGIFSPHNESVVVALNDSTQPTSELLNKKDFTLMYHGLIVERHGLDLAVQAIAKLKQKIPGIKLHLYGESTEYLQTILELAETLEVKDCIRFHGFKTLDEIAHDISKADLGLIPNRLSVFTQINFPTRIFEYLAMNKPVIVPSTRGIRDYFKDDEILYFEPNNADDLAAKIEWAYQNPANLQHLVENGRQVYEKNRWELEQEKFLGIVGDMVNLRAA
ncbi:MAG TPA: glycosyltransferase [Verrucomicrobiae bacterium]|jgi:glycosyltransferase involved in cell wall biosynthesis